MIHRISPDLFAMFLAALAFTVFGAVTGAFFIVVVCGSCLALTGVEVAATLRRRRRASAA